jgi:hypothetical protein
MTQRGVEYIYIPIGRDSEFGICTQSQVRRPTNMKKTNLEMDEMQKAIEIARVEMEFQERWERWWAELDARTMGPQVRRDFRHSRECNNTYISNRSRILRLVPRRLLRMQSARWIKDRLRSRTTYLRCRIQWGMVQSSRNISTHLWRTYSEMCRSNLPRTRTPIDFPSQPGDQAQSNVLSADSERLSESPRSQPA